MRNAVLILLLLCSLSAQAQHRITRAKIAGWGMVAVAGAADGAVNGYEFDGRKSFERKFNVSKTGYFGSQSWKRAYKGNNPDNGFKSDFVRIVGAQDFYHHADDLRKIGYISGGVVIGTQHRKNTKKWHTVADFAIGFAVSSITKSAAMWWIRN